jgi:hypothetical protein
MRCPQRLSVDATAAPRPCCAIGAADVHPHAVRRSASAIMRLEPSIGSSPERVSPIAAHPQPRYARLVSCRPQS